MLVLSIIFGVLMIIMGISLMCTPIATFLSAGYYLSILMLVYGIIGLVRAFKKQSSIFETVASVLGVIFGVAALVRPGEILVLDAVILYMVALWFLVRGIFSIVLAIRVRNMTSQWIWELIIGILSVILGFYSFAHPGVTAVTTGMLIGMYFVESGIDMIVASIALHRIVKALE
ncbi:MAG: DUF308 domain-containing protein [Lachnospiraceae bacterium]|nr:DUF308 domain-containing protein [Lachnospiraceae bacterium]